MQVQMPVSMNAMAENWYALYVKHQHEKSAAASLAGKGFEVFLPLYRSSNRWKDRTKLVLLPLFPNYLFVKANLVHKVEVLRTPGVFWILESAGRSCPIPEGDIATVRMLAEAPAKIEPHAFLKHGDQVRVKQGALAGLQGVLTRIKNQCRVVVSFDLLHKAVAVEVDYANLQLVTNWKESAASPKLGEKRSA